MTVGDNLPVADEDDFFVDAFQSSGAVVPGKEVAPVASDTVDEGVVENAYGTAVDDNFDVDYLAVFDAVDVQLVDAGLNNDLANVDEDVDYVNTVVVYAHTLVDMAVDISADDDNFVDHSIDEHNFHRLYVVLDLVEGLNDVVLIVADGVDNLDDRQTPVALSNVVRSLYGHLPMSLKLKKNKMNTVLILIHEISRPTFTNYRYAKNF